MIYFEKIKNNENFEIYYVCDVIRKRVFNMRIHFLQKNENLMRNIVKNKNSKFSKMRFAFRQTIRLSKFE